MEGWPAQPPVGRDEDEVRVRLGWRYFAFLPIVMLAGAPFWAWLNDTSYWDGYVRGLTLVLLLTVVHYVADRIRRDERPGPTGR